MLHMADSLERVRQGDGIICVVKRNHGDDLYGAELLEHLVVLCLVRGASGLHTGAQPPIDAAERVST